MAEACEGMPFALEREKTGCSDIDFLSYGVKGVSIAGPGYVRFSCDAIRLASSTGVICNRSIELAKRLSLVKFPSKKINMATYGDHHSDRNSIIIPSIPR